MLGTLLNKRYKVIRVLGSGGFGQTYIAEDTQQPDCPKCVVKQLQPACQDVAFLEVARRLFRNEAQTLRKLGSHGQIPALLDDFEDSQEFYLVQEYIEGQPLSEELAAVERLSEPEVMSLLQDVLQILEFVHQNHVIHRDIKPSNLIRRQRDGKFVLIDFGAVKEIQTQLVTEPGQTNYTVGIGTQGYGPSEQLMGKPRYNSDLYALGMTAIQALTGVQPSQLPTHPETGEVIWQYRARVSPGMAAILDKMVRYHFSQRYQSAGEVLEALENPTAVLKEHSLVDRTRVPQSRVSTYPDTEALNLPSVTADLSPHLSTAADLSAAALSAKRSPLGTRLACLAVGMASLMVTGLLVGARQLGWLQPLELAAFDRMVQLSPSLGPDPRLLVVGITEADIQAQKRFPLSDRTVAEALKVLKSYQPRAIGLDLLRDIPQTPGTADLLAELNAPNLIAITKLGSATTATIPPPPSVSPERVGFNDFVLDPDGIIRRNLIFADSQGTSFYSFSLRLALAYLAPQGLSPSLNPQDTNIIQLGRATFHPLESHSGGYAGIDARGYQLLLKYRGRNVAQQVSLEDVLEHRVKPAWVKDKIVLIGTIAESGRDLFSTPYSATEKDAPRMAGVFIHAEMVSQLLSAALDGQPLFWFWPDWAEMGWILTWAVLGGSLAWSFRHPLVLGLSEAGLLIVLSGIGFSVFSQQGWIPVAAPGLAAIVTAGLVVTSRAYWIPLS